jgi:hypothetical protein
MKMMTLLFSLSLLCKMTFAQDEAIKRLRIEALRVIPRDPNDTSHKTWRKGGLYGLNVSQGTLNNWAAGGENFSLSVNSQFSLYAFYTHGKHTWDNTFDMNLGYVRTTSLGGRKNDDRFDFLSKYGHAITSKLNIATLLNVRSQIFRGYTFTDSTKTHVSGFMAPGYLLLSLGLDYKPIKDLSIFISPATARWVFVKDTALSNKGLYGVPAGKHSALEFGGFASISYIKEFGKNFIYKGRLDLFSNYRHNPENIDINMSNAINARISKKLAVNYTLDLIYDDDVRLFGKNKRSAALQLKSLLGIGFLVKF